MGITSYKQQIIKMEKKSWIRDGTKLLVIEIRRSVGKGTRIGEKMVG